MAESETYEVAIVGGGPAGLSAGIWLGRYMRRTVLIDSGDPRNWLTRGVNSYLGLPEVKPAELRGRGREECRKYGVALVDDEVERVRSIGDRLELSLAEGPSIVAERLLLAIGLKDVWPEVPGLERCFGETAHVCPDCDGYEARDEHVAVIGRGRKAVGMALSLSNWTPHIVVCTNGDDTGLDAELQGKLNTLGIPVLTAPIACVHERDQSLRSIELANGIQLEVQRLFFSIAQYPADDLGEQLGCERDEDGHIVIGDAYQTTVRNVYAAGDIVPGPQLAIAAASDGAIAALAIHRSLLPAEKRLG